MGYSAVLVGDCAGFEIGKWKLETIWGVSDAGELSVVRFETERMPPSFDVRVDDLTGTRAEPREAREIRVYRREAEPLSISRRLAAR